MTNTTTTGTAEAGTVYEGTTADYTARIHYAMRADGQWFVRYQERDPRYGYRWGAWRQGGAPSVLRATGRKARLPRAA